MIRWLATPRLRNSVVTIEIMRLRGLGPRV